MSLRLSALLFGVLLLLPGVAAAQDKARPNILFLIADDWSWPHAGAYGDKVVRTPNFDKIARKGVLFQRAYTAAPSCTPSRAAILTGQMPHRLNEGGNLWGVLPGQYTTFAELLQRAGYVCGLVGKGWGPGSLEGTGRTHNPAGPPAKNFREFLKAVPADRPFYFWFGSSNPHRPYAPGSGAKAGLNPDKVKVPTFWPDNPTVRQDVLDYYKEVEDFDRQVGEILQALEESGRAGNTIIVITSDNGMPFPRCKANLYDWGTRMPLAVCWTDRAKGGREAQTFLSFTDFAPTFLEAAGLKVPAAMTGRSFLPLLLDEKATAHRDKVFTERERHANVRQGDASYPARALRNDRFLYIRNLRPDRWPAGDPVTHFAVGPYGDIDDGPTKRVILQLQASSPAQRPFFELCCGKRPAEELYDCQKDPDQIHNVIDDPAYAEARSQLRAELEQWMRATDDPRAGPNGGDDRWDRYKYYGGSANAEKRRKKKG